MGFLDKINKLWSGADFWDKKENKSQRDNFAKEDEERKRRKAAEAKARAQANRPQQQQNTPTVVQNNTPQQDLPRKPNAASDAAIEAMKLSKPQTYKKIAPNPEIVAENRKKDELKAFKEARMERAIEQEKSQTSWLDRQFTDRKWDKRAEARAISGAAQDYQEKYGWNKDETVLQYGRTARGKIAQSQKNQASNWLAPVISTGRVGTGLVQGVAGLYDLATPGEGTNRLSDASTKKAEEQDQLAKDFGIDKVYKTGNVVGEIASYFIPGMIAAKASKGAHATVKGASILGKGATKVDDVARAIDKAGDSGKFRSFIARRMRQNFTLEEAIQEFLITGRYMGQNTGRGDATTAQSVITDVATAMAGALLIPTKYGKRGLDNLLEGDSAVDDAAGAVIAGAADTVDNAVSRGAKNADVPRAPRPEVPEVATGVKSTNLVDNAVPNTPPPAAATPPVQPVTQPTVGAPELAPPGQSTPIVPSRVNLVPEAPQTINPEIQRQTVANDQALAEAATAPAPVPATPTATPVETNVIKASKEAPKYVAPPVKSLIGPDASIEELRASGRFSEEQIAGIMEYRAKKANPTKPEVDPVAEAQKAEVARTNAQAAKDAGVPEAPKQAETPKKPRLGSAENPLPPQKSSVKERMATGLDGNSTKAEVKAELERFIDNAPGSRYSDMTTKQRTAYGDKLAKAMDGAKPEAPVKPKNVDEARRAKQAEDIRAEGEAMGASKADIQAEIDKTTAPTELAIDDLYKDVDGITRKSSTGEALTKAEADELGIKQTKPTTTVVEDSSDWAPEAPSKPKKMTKAQKDQLEIDRANSVRKAEGSEPLPDRKPTQAELNAGAVDNTIKSGKVSKAWKDEQIANGATQKQVDSAVEKVQGKKVEKTADQQAIAEKRAENNKVARENKKQAEAEGKDKQAAPNVTKSIAKQRAEVTGTPEEIASIERRYRAETKSTNIEEGLTKAHKSLNEVSDDGVLDYARKVMTESDDLDEAERIFNSMALSKRLDNMRLEAGDSGLKLDKELIDLADEVAQGQALTAGRGGLINRLTQEILKNVPAPVRVKKRIKDLTKKFDEMGLEFKPSEADEAKLVKMTDDFDKSSTTMLGLEDELTANMSEFSGKTTKKQADALAKKADQLEAKHVAAQEQAVSHSSAFNEALLDMLPELTKKQKRAMRAVKTPDVVSNYLRLAMLSAPTGRIRDAISTSINVADQTVVNLISSSIGKVANKTVGTNLIDNYGSSKAARKGVSGAWDKVKASWSGKPTLDEATGRTSTHSRAELKQKDSISSFGVNHGDKGSQYNIPKKLITTFVQAPTDASYGLYTDRLYKLGLVDARAKGITDEKMAKQYAKMFMDNPSKDAALDAGEVWLKASGMQKNQLSKTLTKAADKLDAWGSKTVDGDGNKLSTTKQVRNKTVARVVRTTTIPFVQYTGGSTHAMLMSQNPVSNVSQMVKAFKSGNTQKAIDELSRGVWNTTKIAGLIAAMETNAIETSDVDADGKTSFNGPYVVRNGEYIPMGSYGIAGGAALISAHFLKRGYSKMRNGDVVGGISDIIAGPPTAIVKASGLDNMLSGTNVLGGATENFEQANSDPDKTPGEVASSVAAGLVGDLGSQAVPAASRDINSFVDQSSLNPTKEKPDTSGKGADGKVNPWKKAGAQIISGVPVLSQSLPRKSGQQARTFMGRVKNANTQSEQQAAEIKAKKTEETTTVNRTADVVSDDKVANLLSEEVRAIYDKYDGDMSKASPDDSDKIWKEVTAAKDRLIDDGSYESYSKILTYERDEAKAESKSTPTEIAKMDRDISRADVAKERKTKPQIFRLYTGEDGAEGGGISNGEFKKMLQLDKDGNPKYPDVYDPDTAMLLWELDEAMTAAGASKNSSGIDPWTRNKYNLDEALGRGAYAKKGSAKKGKGVGTNFGTIGAYAKAPSGSQGQKYKNLTNKGSLPNLTTVSAKTKLKKNISVVKGVRL